MDSQENNVAFNLSKFGQGIAEVPQGVSNVLGDEIEKAEGELEIADDPLAFNDVQTESATMNPKMDNAAEGRAAQKAFEVVTELLAKAWGEGISTQDLLQGNQEYMNLKNTADQFDVNSFALTDQQAIAVEGAAESKLAEQYSTLVQTISSQVNELRKARQSIEHRNEMLQQQRGLGIASFNLKYHKSAQVVAPDAANEQARGLFIQKYLDPLINYQGDKGQMDAISEQMKQELIETASPMLEDEAGNALESIQATDFSDRDRAAHALGIVYDKMVSKKGFEALQTGQAIMSKNNPK